MGYYTKDGIPYINDKPAEPCTCDDRGGAICTLNGCFQPYRCPECGAHLSTSGICLNACHLTAAQFMNFQRGINDAAARVRGDEA